MTAESADDAMETTDQLRIEPRLNLGVVILAAGSSRRMGRQKMLLPWRGTSVLGHIIRQWQFLGAQQVTVVIATSAMHLQQELERLHCSPKNWIRNPAPERGMFSSVQCAANWSEWSEKLTHWALALGDQPHLGLETLRRLLEFTACNPTLACQPTRLSRWKHPLVLPKPLFQQLTSSKALTLREFLSGCDRAGFECEDPGLDQDIDTPEDYSKALQLGG